MKVGRIASIVIIGIIASMQLRDISKAAIADVSAFESNMRKKNDQTVLAGQIDSLDIIRPQLEFHLGPGKITMFDFGASRPCAMVYEGGGRFVYSPPDFVELGQLHKFTGHESLDGRFKWLTLIFTRDLEGFPDTSALSRGPVPDGAWKKFSSTVDDAFRYLGVYMPNMIIGNLLTETPGFITYADFELNGVGHLIFMENPALTDQFALYKITNMLGVNDADMVGGYSEDDELPSQRGIETIDITNYKIESEMSGSGKMTVKCRIDYTPVQWGRSFLYFDWYYENKDIQAADSNGDSLTVINRKDESGFGVVLKKPLEIGKSDYIDIEYECKSLFSVYGLMYIFGKTSWFPSNPIRDPATFELTYDIPKSYEIVSCGKRVEFSQEGGRAISRWIVDKPVEYVSFNMGVFDSKELSVENLPPVKVFMSKQIDHQAIALERAKAGNLSSGDMIGQVSADVTNSLALFTSILGPCPFDTIKATEIPFSGEGQGSPGLIHLTWSTFQAEDLQGYSESFRAHEVAHQWWGHIVDYESYRDVWLSEGLADYCGLWFYELSVKDRKALANMLKYYREAIFSGTESHEIGYKAGPMSVGYRLSSTRSDDYFNIVYLKGAYVFHMIRYLLHDYKTASDDAFADFLKDMVTTYKGKVVTTKLLQKLLEKHIGSDMSWFFDEWVYGTAIPEYEFGYDKKKTDDGKYSVVCHVSQKNVPESFQMLVPITVLFEGDRYIHLKLWIDQPEADIDLPGLPFEPKDIVFNTYDAVLCRVDYK